MTLSTADVSSVSSTAASSLGLQDFVRVLTTQLTYQDPLKPMDNQEFMAQVAQFTALEQSQQINERLQQLIGNQAALQSVGLIGRSIEFSTSTGRSSGVVTALSLQGDAPLLTVSLSGGSAVNDVSLAQILAVR